MYRLYFYRQTANGWKHQSIRGEPRNRAAGPEGKASVQDRQRATAGVGRTQPITTSGLVSTGGHVDQNTHQAKKAEARFTCKGTQRFEQLRHPLRLTMATRRLRGSSGVGSLRLLQRERVQFKCCGIQNGDPEMLRQDTGVELFHLPGPA